MSCEPEMGYNNVIFTHLHYHATVGGRMGFMDYIFSFEIHNTLLSFLVLRSFWAFERELLLFIFSSIFGRKDVNQAQKVHSGTFYNTFI